jgi:hypothetical protein
MAPSAVATFKSWTNKSALSFFDILLFHVQKQVLSQIVIQLSMSKMIQIFLKTLCLTYSLQNSACFWIWNSRKLKKLRALSSTFKSSYWGPFSGLKIQDLIKTSRTFPCVILCPRPFNNSLIELDFDWKCSRMCKVNWIW